MNKHLVTVEMKNVLLTGRNLMRGSRLLWLVGGQGRETVKKELAHPSQKKDRRFSFLY